VCQLIKLILLAGKDADHLSKRPYIVVSVKTVNEIRYVLFAVILQIYME
jgi:hypothetical protein